MLLAENQVIERNIEHLPSGNVLLVDILNDSAIHEFSRLRSDINWYGFTPFFDTWQQLKKQHPQQMFFSEWLTDKDFHTSSLTTPRFDAIVIYFPKTKLRFDYYLSMLSRYLTDDATIYVVGEKKGGVKNCAKALSSYSNKANKLDSARHCMMFAAAYNGLSCNKSLNDWYQKRTVKVEINSTSLSLDLYSLPGVFSANGVDNGTQLLLKTMETVKGEGLDFGCGCGVISASVAKANNCKMTAIDVDALAVASSNKTFLGNKINAQALSSNGLSEILTSSKTFDFVVTNPPFHTGINTDYSITEQLIKQSKKILNHKFQYWMVANSFLPYPQLFTKYLKSVITKANDKRFKVYKI